MTPTGRSPSSADGELSSDQSLSLHSHALRALAELIETAGIAGLQLTVTAIDSTNEIVIQVPKFCGGLDERAAAVAWLAAAVGSSAVLDKRPGPGSGWVCADGGKLDGHSIQIFTSIEENWP